MNIEREIAAARKRICGNVEMHAAHNIGSTAHLREHHVRAMAQRFRKLERDIFGALRASDRRQA